MSRFELLSQTPLFADCTEQQIVKLSEIAREQVYENGALVFAHGDEAKHLMVVADGKIRLELPISILGESKNIPFEAKQRGDVVGWSALVPPFHFTLAGRASPSASVLAFPRAALTALLDSDANMGDRVMRNLAAITAQRLQHTQDMWAREVQRSLDEQYR